jgi:hypothetical protein
VARWKEVCARCPPPGLSLPVTFTGSGDTVGGTPADPGVEPGRNFTVQGTGDQGQPLYQAYTINVNQNEPLAINASGGTDLGPGTVGQPFAQNFFLSGGAGPYTWHDRGRLPPASSAAGGHDHVRRLDHGADFAAFLQAELADCLDGDRGHQADAVGVELHVGYGLAGVDAGDAGRDLVTCTELHDLFLSMVIADMS